MLTITHVNLETGVETTENFVDYETFEILDSMVPCFVKSWSEIDADGRNIGGSDHPYNAGAILHVLHHKDTTEEAQDDLFYQMSVNCD